MLNLSTIDESNQKATNEVDIIDYIQQPLPSPDEQVEERRNALEIISCPRNDEFLISNHCVEKHFFLTNSKLEPKKELKKRKEKDVVIILSDYKLRPRKSK